MLKSFEQFEAMWRDLRNTPGREREYFLAWASRNVAEAWSSNSITKEQFQNRVEQLRQLQMDALYPEEASDSRKHKLPALPRETVDSAISMGKIRWHQECLASVSKPSARDMW